jgi:putative DNA primase/helicase
MIVLARTEEPVVVSITTLDSSPWLLNVQNGTLDLTTGDLRPYDPADLITRVAPVAYDSGAEAPTWRGFLHTVMGGDEQLIRYLQRLVGYALTGQTTEHILAFLHGYGANGKTTFLNTILALLGPYGKQADPMLLVARSRDPHPTNMADLVGSRFVVCSEVDDGRHMAEAAMKQLTGGDRIKARFMHRDFFEFEPTHKIWLAANNKPIVRNNDHGVWRRIRLIPFTVTIPAEEQDRDLPEKLRAELPGILAWAVEGCLEWRRGGLRDPESVRAATQGYRDDMDLIGQFIVERCEEIPGRRAQAQTLYAAYRTWCEENGLHPCSQQAFGRRLSERGFESRRSTGGRVVYDGLDVRPN